MHRTIAVIYATTTGHTEFVADILERTLRVALPQCRIVKQRAEVTQPEDLARHEVLVLACGSWNTGNVEGQLSPAMHDLVTKRAHDVKLRGIAAAAIGLGDERYYYTARSATLLQTFLQERGATIVLPALTVINDPYDQEAKVAAWAKELAANITASAKDL